MSNAKVGTVKMYMKINFLRKNKLFGFLIRLKEICSLPPNRHRTCGEQISTMCHAKIEKVVVRTKIRV